MENKSPKVQRTDKKGVLSKLQTLFKPSNPVPIQSGTQELAKPQLSKEELSKLIKEALYKLNYSEPLPSRISFVKEFTEFVKVYSIGDVTAIWNSVQDLFDPNQPMDVQELGFEFLCAIIIGQYDHLGSLRATFFRLIKVHPGPLDWKLEIVKVLTKDGFDIQLIEDNIGSLLLQWLTLPATTEPSQSSNSNNSQFLEDVVSLVCNTMYYNSKLIDPSIHAGIIKAICGICNNTSSAAVVQACLNFFDIMVNDSHNIGSSSTSTELVVTSLCKTVNIERFCKRTWHIMSNLLNSYYGIQTIRCLCSILSDSTNYHVVNLLRGAVFFIGMSMWGSQRINGVENKIPISYVLPSLSSVLESNQSIVAYEVLLSLQRLVKKYGHELKVEWDTVLTILLKLKTYLSALQVYYDQEYNSSLKNISRSFETIFADTLTCVIDLSRKEMFLGSRILLINLFSGATLYLPEASVLAFADEMTKYCHPVYEDWLPTFTDYLALLFISDTRYKIRAKALADMKRFYTSFKDLLEDSLLNQAIIPTLKTIYMDDDTVLKAECVDFLLELASQSNIVPSCCAVVDVLDNTARVEDQVRVKAVQGMLSLFKQKFSKTQPALTVYTFQKIIKYFHATLPVTVIKDVLTSMLALRSDSNYQLSIAGTAKATPFLRCARLSSSITSYGVLPINSLMKELVKTIQHTTNGEVLRMILDGISTFMRNRYIMHQVDVSALANLLCKQMDNKTFAVGFIDSPGRMEENYEKGLTVLTLLIPYVNSSHCTNPKSCAQELVNTFAASLSYKWHTLTLDPEWKWKFQVMGINGISLCVLELSHCLQPLDMTKITEAVMTYLSVTNDVTYDFSLQHLGTSQNKRTPVSVQILEFLRLVTAGDGKALKQVAVSQFEALFKVLPAFMDSKRYSWHVCALASQVLSLWFLHSRLTDRPQYFSIITKLLAPYIRDRGCLLSQALTDLLARYSYTNHHEHTYYSHNATHTLPASNTSAIKYWIVGNTVLSIRTSSLGWAEVSLRRATGTSRWLMQLQSNQLYPLIQKLFHTTFTAPPILDVPIPFSPPPLQPSPLPTSQIQLIVSPPEEMLLEYHPVESPEEEEEERQVEVDVLPLHRSQSYASLGSTPSRSIRSVKSMGSLLSVFYPPLPSYEFNDDNLLSPEIPNKPSDTIDTKEYIHSPSFVDFVEIEPTPSLNIPNLTFSDGKISLSLEAQMLLHSSPLSPDEEQNDNQLVFEPAEPPAPEDTPQLSPQLDQQTTPEVEDADIAKQGEVLPKPVTPLVEIKSEDNVVYDPNYILLQIQQIPFAESIPKALRQGDGLERAITVLDSVPWVQPHKIGILYVDSAQTNLEQILTNQVGSRRYHEFLMRLGQIMSLKDCAAAGLYTGGLDAESPEVDGLYTLVRIDPVYQIMFHVATLMPNPPSDKNMTNKKSHIGNDNVILIYSQTQTSFSQEIISGQFNFVNIIIYPKDNGYYLIEVKKKPDVPDFGPISGSQVVSEAALVPLVLQTALNADLTCMIMLSQGKDDYISNAAERLRQIKQIETRYMTETG